jgi:hypothetical protein
VISAAWQVSMAHPFLIYCATAERNNLQMREECRPALTSTQTRGDDEIPASK